MVAIELPTKDLYIIIRIYIYIHSRTTPAATIPFGKKAAACALQLHFELFSRSGQCFLPHLNQLGNPGKIIHHVTKMEL